MLAENEQKGVFMNKMEWPNNLMTRIFRRRVDVPVSEDIEKRLLAQINELANVQKEILLLYYKEGQSLRNIASDTALSNAEKRKLAQEAEETLRARRKELKVEFFTYEQMEHKFRLLEEENRLLKEQKAVLAECLACERPLQTFTMKEMGFSVRTFNILWREGCRTAKDVLELAKNKDLGKVRNLGKNSREEIRRFFHDYFGRYGTDTPEYL